MKPWLYLPPSIAYKISPFFIQIYGKWARPRELNWSPFLWRDLHFKNPLGLAGGVDKDGENIKNWWSFGPGFIEIGTVTPKPQAKNPGKVLDRDRKNLALWNHLGFPSRGVKALALKFRKQKKPYFTPVFISIGKNRWTANENAIGDLIDCVKELKDFADAFVLNISSPNTKGLRDLFQLESLRVFLSSFFDEYKKVFSHSTKEDETTKGNEKVSSHFSHFPPVLIKLSPDHKEEEFEDILNLTYEEGVEGWIVTNSSLRTSSHFDSKKLKFPPFGGVSGKFIRELSKNRLKQVVYFLKKKKENNKSKVGQDDQKKKERLIISSGGILSAEDVFERLELGANLVQVYSALVFNGPFFFQKVFRKYTS